MKKEIITLIIILVTYIICGFFNVPANHSMFICVIVYLGYSAAIWCMDIWYQRREVDYFEGEVTALAYPAVQEKPYMILVKNDGNASQNFCLWFGSSVENEHQPQHPSEHLPTQMQVFKTTMYGYNTRAINEKYRSIRFVEAFSEGGVQTAMPLFITKKVNGENIIMAADNMGTYGRGWFEINENLSQDFMFEYEILPGQSVLLKVYPEK